MMQEKIERLRDLAYETGWLAARAELDIKVDEDYQKRRIEERNQAAAEIAKLWEDTEVEIIEQYQDCLDKHHVQLAEMRQRLVGIECELGFALVTYHGLPPEIEAVRNLAKKALSAAPKEEIE